MRIPDIPEPWKDYLWVTRLCNGTERGQFLGALNKGRRSTGPTAKGVWESLGPKDWKM